LTESSASEIAKSASIASRRLATVSNEARNFALTTLHDALLEKRDFILQANERDVALATRAAANGELSQSVLKRLDLSRPGKYDDMLSGILNVRALEDPSICTHKSRMTPC
jgi:glutamate-5-semialdehyde dehydrogenase